ncbi:hypothetical protein T265_01688 [Opisthorchis viverrini]|uniref:Uncharacterized protein n=1 Tax=Opisthorchis viverrini TaxID=6198 RepID=A0A075AIU8_OPIVI|nr:hypothetical protein T265_01688 [Opisthorchis viverrini]KER32259.1 hypothetical protein T265_01688 [Opisthorchis viverrini]
MKDSEEYTHLQIYLVFTRHATESLLYDSLRLNVLHKGRFMIQLARYSRDRSIFSYRKLLEDCTDLMGETGRGLSKSFQQPCENEGFTLVSLERSVTTSWAVEEFSATLNYDCDKPRDNQFSACPLQKQLAATSKVAFSGTVLNSATCVMLKDNLSQERLDYAQVIKAIEPLLILGQKLKPRDGNGGNNGREMLPDLYRVCVLFQRNQQRGPRKMRLNRLTTERLTANLSESHNRVSSRCYLIRCEFILGQDRHQSAQRWNFCFRRGATRRTQALDIRAKSSIA